MESRVCTYYSRHTWMDLEGEDSDGDTDQADNRAGRHGEHFGAIIAIAAAGLSGLRLAAAATGGLAAASRVAAAP